MTRVELASWGAFDGLDGVASRALSQSFGYDGVYQVSAQSQLDGVAWLSVQTSRDAGGPGEALLGLEQVWYGPSASGGHASSRPSAGCVAGARSVPERERIRSDDRRVGMQRTVLGAGQSTPQLTAYDGVGRLSWSHAWTGADAASSSWQLSHLGA